VFAGASEDYLDITEAYRMGELLPQFTS